MAVSYSLRAVNKNCIAHIGKVPFLLKKSSALKRNRKESKKFEANFLFLENQVERRFPATPATPARRTRQPDSYSILTVEMLDDNEEIKTN